MNMQSEPGPGGLASFLPSINLLYLQKNSDSGRQDSNAVHLQRREEPGTCNRRCARVCRGSRAGGKDRTPCSYSCLQSLPPPPDNVVSGWL